MEPVAALACSLSPSFDTEGQLHQLSLERHNLFLSSYFSSQLMDTMRIVRLSISSIFVDSSAVMGQSSYRQNMLSAMTVLTWWCIGVTVRVARWLRVDAYCRVTGSSALEVKRNQRGLYEYMACD